MTASTLDGGATPSAEASRQERNRALDLARGLIVAVMALDHVRIYFSSAQFEPTDLDATNGGWFMTRFVTHLCAPGFFFIAGLGAALMEQRGTTKAQLAKFLLVRGFLLILLEILIFGLAWSFNPGWFWFGVIAGLGAAMILLAGAIFIPRAILLVVAVAFVLLHNALWPAVAVPHTLNVLIYSGGVSMLPLIGPRILLYPLLPWAALMVLGYAASAWLMPGARPQPRRLAFSGAAMLALFAACRAAGFGQSGPEGYDPSGNISRQLLSFLNVDKYPPSLQFVLVTLGLMALFLAAFASHERSKSPLLRPLYAYGRVPFFFYLVHIFLIHALAVATAAALGWPLTHLRWSGVGPSLMPPDGYGYGLAGIYAMWLIVLAILYPLCRWYAEVKAARPENWLRFF